VFDLFTTRGSFPVMPAAKSATETAVRSYLLYLEDPAALRDESAIAEHSKAVANATDPIDKLKALAALASASTIDEAPLRDGFVTHAKAWAEAQSVPPGAFRELKVPDDVLRAAGFTVPSSGGRQGRAASAVRQRAKAVPVEEIKAHVLAQKGTFLLADVINGAGGSQATVRKALDELIDAGKVQKLGPVPDYKGRGRAPLQYKRT
jgi:hypothetical protein